MRNQRSPARAGFTLIELLVVIAIIALLASLLSAAALRMIASQQYSNTVTGLKLFSTKATTHWRTVADKANVSTAESDAWIGNWQSSHPGQLPTAARAAYVNAKLVQAFPVTFTEALNPGNGLAAWPAYQTYLASLGITSNTPAGPNDSAVCLLMVLTQGPYNTGSDTDAFGGANISKQPIGNGSADLIIDGYQTPVSVTRTSTGLVITSAGQDRIFGTADDLVSNKLQQ